MSFLAPGWLDLADGLGPWLVYWTVRASFVVALAALITRMLRARPAADRHAIWAVAIAAVVMLPPLSALVPRLAPAPWLDRTVTWHVDGLDARFLPAAPAGPKPERPGSSPNAVAGTPERRPEASPAARRGWFWPAVTCLWLAGALIGSLRWLSTCIGLGWVARRARPIADKWFVELAHGLAGDFGIRVRIRWLYAADATAPATWGFVTPTVLLPAAAREWPAARLRAVLIHELAHVSRRDVAWQALLELVQIFQWWNPLVFQAG